MAVATNYGVTLTPINSGVSERTSITVALPTAAVADQIVFAFVAVNKSSGTVPTCVVKAAGGTGNYGAPTLLHDNLGASISGALYFITAKGGEKEFTFSWSTLNYAVAFAVQYPAGTLGTAIDTPNSETAVNTISTGTVTMGANNGVAISFFAVDTGSLWQSNGGPTVDNGWERVTYPYMFDGTNNDVGIGLAEKPLSAFGTSSTNWFTTVADQVWTVTVPLAYINTKKSVRDSDRDTALNYLGLSTSKLSTVDLQKQEFAARAAVAVPSKTSISDLRKLLGKKQVM